MCYTQDSRFVTIKQSVLFCSIGFFVLPLQGNLYDNGAKNEINNILL